MSEEELSELSLILLNEAHTIKPFDCEDIDLNEFLFEKAKWLSTKICGLGKKFG